MYRDLCCDASAKSVSEWWQKKMPDGSPINPAIAPGGFAETCFAGSNVDPAIEYLYIKDRKGFVRLAIENGADLGTTFSFNVSSMYRNFPFFKGLRARISQKIFLGVSWPIGKYGSMMPLTDKVPTVNSTL